MTPLARASTGTGTGATRAAIVTGGARGIGQAVVTRLAAAGYNVAVGYLSGAEQAEKVVRAVTATGRRGFAFRGDVADEDAMGDVFTRAAAEFGGVDVVVHAAAQMQLTPLVDLDLAVLDRIHRSNIRGSVVVAQQAARAVRRGGAIIMVSTSMVAAATPTYGVYSASKAAGDALTLVLARELRGRDITVNAVAAGPTATDLFFTDKDEQTITRLISQTPLERLGMPADIAAAVAFLASPEARWINGQVLRCNGGII